MPSLKEEIQEDLNSALKESKEAEISVLRFLLALVLNKEKEERYKLSKKEPNLSPSELDEKSQLSDDEIIEIIAREVKKRKEAISEFKKGKREDLVQKEEKEIEILERYLPEQMPAEEIEKIAREIIKRVGATEIKDMGRVMKELVPQTKGRADGKLVSEIVKKLLSENKN